MQVLDSWPSCTSLDGADSQHGGLSSTYSSLQQYAMEDFPSASPAFIPTPAGMDVRASKGTAQTAPCQQKQSRHLITVVSGLANNDTLNCLAHLNSQFRKD